MAAPLSSLASVDGSAAAVDLMSSNTLKNNFNAAVDLSSLFGGYNVIGELVGQLMGMTHCWAVHSPS
jgi:hypothetical protein